MSDQTTSTALSFLAKELGRIVDDRSVGPDVVLAEIGADSLLLVELLLACEELYSKKIDFEQLAIDKATTLRDLDRQIRAL